MGYLYLVAGFIGGLISGAGGVLLYGSYMISKTVRRSNERLASLGKNDPAAAALYKALLDISGSHDKVRADMLATPDPMTQQAELADSVTKRLRQASEINSKQSRISPNAADLTYNNLELEKLSILQTILRDGFDPLITIRLDRGDQQMKLSSYIAQIQRSLN